MELNYKHIVSFGFVCLFALTVNAQRYSLWGNLKPGIYKVGFKSEWKIDYTRTWGQSNDVKENYSSVKPFGRPVRVSIWYPASISANAITMKFSDYVFIKGNNALTEFAQKMVLENDLGNETKSLKGLFNGSLQAYQNLLKTNVPVYKNANAIPKKFPVIIYSLGQGDYTQENTVLFEYLASYGYIVVSVPQLSANPRRDYLVIDDPLSWDTQLRDLEFALSEILLSPNADGAKIGAMGMSMGSTYTFMLAGKNQNIKSLVGLDGTIVGGLPSFGYKYWTAPYVDSANIKIPVLELFREDHHDFSRINSMIYADRYLITIKGLTHTDFTSYPMYSAHTQDNLLDTFSLHRRTTVYAFDMHQKVCSYVKEFFDATLKQQPQAINFVMSLQNNFKENNISAEFLNGIKAFNEEEFVKIILQQGTDAAISKLKNLQQTYHSVVWLRQKKLNRMGYEMVYKSDFKKALDIFRFNAAAFPDVAEVYNSLADGYEMNNNKDLAIQNYRKALELNPSDENAKKNIQRLIQSK